MSLDEQRLAAGAAGILPIPDPARPVARIHVVQPFLLSNLHRTQERLDRCVVRILHFVIGMEGGHVPGDVGRDAHQELCDVPQFLIRIVEARNGERDDFDPESQLVKAPDSLEHVGEHAAEAGAHVGRQVAVVVVRRDVELVCLRPSSIHHLSITFGIFIHQILIVQPNEEHKL